MAHDETISPASIVQGPTQASTSEEARQPSQHESPRHPQPAEDSPTSEEAGVDNIDKIAQQASPTQKPSVGERQINTVIRPAG